MNFYSIIAIGYILVAGILIYIIARDLRGDNLFLARHKIFSLFFILILSTGIILAIDARFVEINIIRTTESVITNPKITKPIKIAFISDIQTGLYKKTAWTQRIVDKINKINPDLVLIGGDLISNEYAFEDESRYLEPLKQIADKYPSYYVLGNHEYGIGAKIRCCNNLQTGNRSDMVIKKMNTIGVQLLLNNLTCPEIKEQKICIFGTDDLWGGKINFQEYKQSDGRYFSIFLIHNPDTMLYWPKDADRQPDLILTGHTHGGQLWIPRLGPLGGSELNLGQQYHRGLNYYNNIPIYTSVGLGESGGPLRLFTWPEITVVDLQP